MASFTTTIEPRSVMSRLDEVFPKQRLQQVAQMEECRSADRACLTPHVFALGMRHSRFHVQAKTHLQFLIAACALNPTRVMHWCTEAPDKKTLGTLPGR